MCFICALGPQKRFVVRSLSSRFLYAFDLLRIGVDDLRRDPLEVRKATLASVLTSAGGIRDNEHIEGDCEDSAGRQIGSR